MVGVRYPYQSSEVENDIGAFGRGTDAVAIADIACDDLDIIFTGRLIKPAARAASTVMYEGASLSSGTNKAFGEMAPNESAGTRNEHPFPFQAH